MRTAQWAPIMAATILLLGESALAAPEKDPLKPRVPADQMAEAKKLSTPLYQDARRAPAKIVEEGKALYEGKGTCFNCHGKSGKGDGVAGAMLNPGPRDLTNCQFQNARSDGELFWIIKNGSPGSGMISLVPGALTEEEAWKVIAYVRSFCAKGGK
ncbi:MAG TPA: cytochrome c [Nitrospiraceae bacterium]|jgi:mono/diheme cytochrome c family protein|nr:cytochrome c [Nitrospiraceae bacterium]